MSQAWHRVAGGFLGGWRQRGGGGRGGGALARHGDLLGQAAPLQKRRERRQVVQRRCVCRRAARGFATFVPFILRSTLAARRGKSPPMPAAQPRRTAGDPHSRTAPQAARSRSPNAGRTAHRTAQRTHRAPRHAKTVPGPPKLNTSRSRENARVGTQWRRVGQWNVPGAMCSTSVATGELWWRLNLQHFWM